MKTAFEVAEAMNLSPLARQMLDYDYHPQNRTEAFHEVFGAPIRRELPDDSFSHMDDQRVAFRLSFILSEAIEILEKGLGIDVCIGFKARDGSIFRHFATSSDNARLCDALLSAMKMGTKRNVVEVVDGLADLNVVTNGFALELGVDMLEIDREVYASNLTKLDENGEPIVADGSNPKYPAGKILKGPNFVEPQIAYLLGLAEQEDCGGTMCHHPHCNDCCPETQAA